MMFDAEWPDATEVVTRHLADALDVPVRWAPPAPRPAEFVVVRRTGDGAAPRWAERAILDVECWSGQPNGNPKPAHTLASAVKRALLALPTGNNPVGDAYLTGRAFMPDPTSNVPRVILGVAVLIRPRPTS